MQRTCFALATLLGWMASSMLVVGTTSQTRVESVAWLPGPGSVCGLATRNANPSLILGQSIDEENDDWSEEIGSADQVINASEQPDRVSALTSSLSEVGSDSGSPAANGWWVILGTGYDAAYDFAMLEGKYVDNSLGQREIEPQPPALVEDSASDLGETYTVSGLSSSVTTEDLDELFASEEGAISTTAQICPWSGLDLTEDSEATFANEQGQAASTVTEQSELPTTADAAWLLEKLQVTQDWAGNQLRPMWEATSKATWMTDLRDRWTQYQAESRSNDSLNQDASNPDAIVSEPVAGATQEGPGPDREEAQPASTPVVTEDFQEEVLLITAAETLDRIGLRLQEAAQYLRYWAAGRVVSKGDSRRVARSLDERDSNSHE